MPRVARKKSETGIYHIIIRGINKQDIFEDDEDYEKFLQVVQQYKEKSVYQIYAYCLMGNHMHLLLKVGQEPLAQIMRRICGSYVYWYNWKYKRIGNLFQGRFKSEPVENDKYFLTVLRYIHQNPVKAGIEKDVVNYKWSSYNEYINIGKLTDIDFALSMFHEDKKKSIKLFDTFTHETNDEKCLEIEENHRITDEEAKSILKIICNMSTPSEFQRLDMQERNRILKDMKEGGLSIRQIERLTGINRGIVLKA
jgi:REP element-mobilizing transposase RayT